MKNLDLPPRPAPFKHAYELIAPPLIAAHRIWSDIAGARFAPSRKEIQPAPFKAMLSNLFLVEVVGDGADFRLALSGDTVARFLGSEYKPGKLLGEVEPSPFQQRSFRLFRQCVENKAPVGLGPVRTLHDQRSFFDNEAIVLPLSDDGATVTGLMGVIHLTPARDAVDIPR